MELYGDSEVGGDRSLQSQILTKGTNTGKRAEWRQ